MCPLNLPPYNSLCFHPSLRSCERLISCNLQDAPASDDFNDLVNLLKVNVSDGCLLDFSIMQCPQLITYAYVTGGLCAAHCIDQLFTWNSRNRRGNLAA